MVILGIHVYSYSSSSKNTSLGNYLVGRTTKPAVTLVYLKPARAAGATKSTCYVRTYGDSRKSVALWAHDID